MAYDRDKDGKKIPRAKSIEAIKELQCFKLEEERLIIEGKKGLTQIYRNFLLSETYGLDKGLQSYSIILAPEKHPLTDDEIISLHNELRDEYKDKIKNIYLEEFVNNIVSVCPEAYKSVFERFYDRYLNFDKLKEY